MEFTLATDDWGGLSCSLSDGEAVATIAVLHPSSALPDLMEALGSAGDSGFGECYWRDAAGEYRWMFRRDGEKVRIAVLRGCGTLTGWEHVFWSECDLEPFARRLRDAATTL